MKLRSTLLSTVILLLSCTVYSQTVYEILVSSRATNSVKQYDINGTYIKDFISNGSGGLSNTEDILFHPDGTVLVTGFNNTAVKQFDGITGAYIGDFSSGYSLSSPSKMSIGWDSLLYVTQWGATQNKVVRFDLQGNFVDEFTSNGAPNGIGHAWDDDNNFYIALFGQSGSGTVHKYDTAGNSLGTFVNSSILQGPTDIWFDKNGDLLVEDWSAGTVLRYDSSGQFVNIFLSGMTNPEGIVILPNGDMLIGDWGQDAVHRFDSLGGYIGYFTSGNGLADPNNIAMREQVGASINEINNNISNVKIHFDRSALAYVLQFQLQESTEIVFDIRDQKGTLIQKTEAESFIKGENRISVKLDHRLSNGVYIVSILSDRSAISEKISIID